MRGAGEVIRERECEEYTQPHHSLNDRGWRRSIEYNEGGNAS